LTPLRALLPQGSDITPSTLGDHGRLANHRVCHAAVRIEPFVASSITGVPYLRIAVRAVPYVVALVIGLLIITAVPFLSLTFIPVR
jgi:hypothetical protein